MLERGWPVPMAVPVFVCWIANEAPSEVDLRIAVKRTAHQTNSALSHDEGTTHARGDPRPSLVLRHALNVIECWGSCRGGGKTSLSRSRLRSSPHYVKL